MKKRRKNNLIGFLIDFIFCRLAYSLGFSISHLTFPEVTSVWGVSAVAILDSSVNCVCVWSTKKLTMPVYCVAANCNNSQTTPGITMHELPRNRPAVRRKWIKFVAGELCKLARVTGPEFPHPFFLVGHCLPATGRCRAVRYKRQCLPGFCQGFQARSKDQEILEEGGGAGPSLLPRRDHE